MWFHTPKQMRRVIIMSNQEHEKKVPVRAVERALHILLCFLDERELTLTQIATKTGLHKSTAFRLLATLEQNGFIIREDDGEQYQLGYRIWELSNQVNTSQHPALLCLSEMEQLRDELDETVSLYVRDGHERLRIQSVESRQPIRRVAPVGVRLPLIVGASSKVLVAYEAPDVKNKLMDELANASSIQPELYRAQILQVQLQGFAKSFEEREVGAAAISVPVLTKSKRLIAALTVSGPANRLTSEQMDEILPSIQQSAERMGAKF